jgi:uncharacterized protein YeaO (DUF488 family)
MLYTARKFDKPAHRGKAIEVTRTRRNFFAPSQELLDDYKSGRDDWDAFEKRYLAEIRARYRDEPQPFHDLVERAAREDVTLTCWEKGNEDTIHCHRRLLRDVLREIAQERGLNITPPAETPSG